MHKAGRICSYEHTTDVCLSDFFRRFRALDVLAESCLSPRILSSCYSREGEGTLRDRRLTVTLSGELKEPVARVWLGRGPHRPLCGASRSARTGDCADHFDCHLRPWFHGSLLVRWRGATCLDREPRMRLWKRRQQKPGQRNATNVSILQVKHPQRHLRRLSNLRT